MEGNVRENATVVLILAVVALFFALYLVDLDARLGDPPVFKWIHGYERGIRK